MISRRTLLGLLPFALAIPAMAEDHPSVVFMNQVGKELLHAHRLGTNSAFMRVILRYADVGGIADFSLGTYKLAAGEHARYERGVANFMARYFAEQSRSYPIAKFEIGEATVAENKDVYVAAKVFLMSGPIYSISFQLAWQNGSYKVVDVKILGFSMTAQQRSIFASYLAKNNGNTDKLIVALNR